MWNAQNVSFKQTSQIVERIRAKRYRTFVSACAVRSHEPILDVGGGTGRALARYTDTNPITLLELAEEVWDVGAWRDKPNVAYAIGDARDMAYRDREWPIVFSNSVIEHVGTHEDQQRFANEIRRVSDRYFVQTPNKWFVIEPHYGLPLIQFLPRRARRWFDKKKRGGHRRRNCSPVGRCEPFFPTPR